ncbi:hypothetical protein HOV23_gp069 [Pseudomonas phage Lana]|uniref:Uncharacterized protein n=1 Tax=Pseudomonas phage Lana TaxID=2530172 RepID=A0A481W5Y4_9CAUD|nr:hypothetical protein HOV23_gp069 [Pseudomonas phage Lana]QBJ04504.1 hypothetical protein [Pseudomonas phage Lana]
MADFCKACSEQMFGAFAAENNDLKGLTTQEDWDKGLAASALCEGCGPIQVDPEGNCVSSDCLEHGNPGHGLPWKAVAAPVCQPEGGDKHLEYHLILRGKVNIEGMDAEAARSALMDTLVEVSTSLTSDGAQLDVAGLVFHSEELNVAIKDGDACNFE